jgi:hypothetical protein
VLWLTPHSEQGGNLHPEAKHPAESDHDSDPRLLVDPAVQVVVCDHYVPAQCTNSHIRFTQHAVFWMYTYPLLHGCEHVYTLRHEIWSFTATIWKRYFILCCKPCYAPVHTCHERTCLLSCCSGCSLLCCGLLSFICFDIITSCYMYILHQSSELDTTCSSRRIERHATRCYKAPGTERAGKFWRGKWGRISELPKFKVFQRYFWADWRYCRNNFHESSM